MATLPQKLTDILADFESITDRTERTEYLIELADRFAQVRVPQRIAVQPYSEDNHVLECESQAYVWAEENADGTLKFWFDVLNPQGLSAMAMSVILDDTLSGAPLEEVAAVQPDIVFKLFGSGVSMGKGQGLMGIVRMAQFEATRRLKS